MAKSKKDTTDDLGTKTTIVSSPEARKVSDRLQSDGYFSDGQSAFRFAVFFSLSRGLDIADFPEEDSSGKGQTWGVAAFDPNQEISFLISQFGRMSDSRSQRETYKLVEALGNRGLLEIGVLLEEGAFISELL